MWNGTSHHPEDVEIIFLFILKKCNSIRRINMRAYEIIETIHYFGKSVTRSLWPLLVTEDSPEVITDRLKRYRFGLGEYGRDYVARLVPGGSKKL